MLTRQQIIETIRSIHRQGEPLNITAVKRRHPELMRAVYAIKPYWGWKKALEAAGIKYSDIKVELQDYCECEICHTRRKMLVTHILKKHRIEMEDYRMDYPEADIICEKLRARRAKMKLREMPHWEPLWTVEYALDRLWARYEKGMPINCYAIFLNEPSLMITLQRHFRFRDTALSLHDMVLGMLGLNPEDIRRKHYSMNKKEVLDAIIKRRKSNLPLNFSDMRPSRYERQAFYKGALRIFGSWKKAIEAAGLDYKLIRKNASRYSTAEKLLDEILRRNKAGLPLNSGALFHDAINSDQALCRKGIEIFGSWKKALEAAGIRYKDVALSRRKYSTKEFVIAGIRKRRRAGLPTSAAKVHTGFSADCALYESALLFFKRWDAAVEKAGFSYPEEARRWRERNWQKLRNWGQV